MHRVEGRRRWKLDAFKVTVLWSLAGHKTSRKVDVVISIPTSTKDRLIDIATITYGRWTVLVMCS